MHALLVIHEANLSFIGKAKLAKSHHFKNHVKLLSSDK